jgi:hypothetical protein
MKKPRLYLVARTVPLKIDFQIAEKSLIFCIPICWSFSTVA